MSSAPEPGAHGAAPGVQAPVGGALSEAGDHPVDVPVVCVITRFGLRGARHLIPSLLEYRRVIKAARRAGTPGLLRAAFLIESPTTWYSFSIWSEPAAIEHFGTNIPIHVAAARRGLSRAAFSLDRGPEVWSTKWRLLSVSNNLNWQDFDLREVILNRWKESSDGRC